MELLINDKPQIVLNSYKNYIELKAFIETTLKLKSEDYYLISNGKRVQDSNKAKCSRIHIVPKVLGGKGGFGSMLRAIGAQIEKTTNREACRDLSGRRLRDINEEQRLKTWINQQAEREKESKERKQKKLERLCEMPKHDFKDEQYDKERSQLPEIVEDAVLQGLQASCSTKRKATEDKPIIKKKKAKLWVDDEFDDDLSDSESENEGSDSKESNTSENVSESRKNTSNGENDSNSVSNTDDVQLNDEGKLLGQNEGNDSKESNTSEKASESCKNTSNGENDSNSVSNIDDVQLNDEGKSLGKKPNEGSEAKEVEEKKAEVEEKGQSNEEK